jgi:O-antigen/teichoic acid export membrane protein
MQSMDYIATRRLLSGFAIYGLGDFLLFGLSYIVVIPIMTRFLTPQEYGVVATLTSITLLVSWTMQFGLPSAALRYYYTYSNTTRHEFLVSVWLLCLGLALLVGLVILVLGEPVWNYFVRSAPFYPYAPMIVLIAFGGVTNTFRTVLLRATERPRLYIAADVGQFVCQVLLVLCAIAVADLGVMGVVLGTLVATVISAVISTFFMLYRVHLERVSLRIQGIFGFAWPLYLSYMIGFLQQRSSVLILQFIVAGSAIGLFAIGQQIGSVILMASSSFTKAWQPYLYGQSPDQARRTLYRIGISVPLIMIGVVALGLLSQELIGLLTSSAYEDAWVVVIPVAFGAGMVAISGFVNSGIYYAKRTSYETIVALIAAVFNILISFWLISKMQAIGAAIAAMGTGILTFLLTSSLAQKAFPVERDYQRIVTTIVAGGAILVGWIVAYPRIAQIDPLPIFMGKVLILGCYSFALWRMWLSPEQNELLRRFILLSFRFPNR